MARPNVVRRWRRTPGRSIPERALQVLCLSVVAAVLVGCAARQPPADPPDRGALIDAFGLASVADLDVPYPDDNTYNAARIALGRLLFFDPVLGGEQDVACATCHHPTLAFADGRPLSVGVGGGAVLGPDRVPGVSAVTGRTIPEAPRNAPTVLNASLAGVGMAEPSHLSAQFWDGRVETGLEGQALLPLQSRDEMRGDGLAERLVVAALVQRLRGIEAYETLFREAFPETEGASSAISGPNLERALAAFERELITPDAPFDRWLDGNDDALTDAQKRGLALFFGEAGCGACHNGPMLSDYQFRALGVEQIGPGRPDTRGDDYGRFEATGDKADLYAFRTPTLRNVAITGPYMHDGALETLRDVVAFFNRGGNDRGLPDSRVAAGMAPLNLTDRQMDALVAFLESLTGLVPAVEVPESVPSGLDPVFGLATSPASQLSRVVPGSPIVSP